MPQLTHCLTSDDSRPQRFSRRAWCRWAAGVCLWTGCHESDLPPTTPRNSNSRPHPVPQQDGHFHVRPGESIQAALDAAAEHEQHKVVMVHEGAYRPDRSGQAFLRFVGKHDGIQLTAVGDVTLSAENRQLADPGQSSFPAVVNHIVYFGHGITKATKLTGFRITGANGYVAASARPTELEPVSEQTNPRLRRGMFYYSDGGAIKIFGDSSPVLSQLLIEDNATVLCGGGASIENCGYVQKAARFEDCIFRNNRCPGTGSAIDVLEGSIATIHNCLFVANIANTGMEEIARKWGLVYNAEHGCGAVTVFPNSRVTMTNSTLTRNWNGVDDRGQGSEYRDCIFWMNNSSDGSRPGQPYEIDIRDASGVRNCHIHGTIADLRKTIDSNANTIGATDPSFDDTFVPQNSAYSQIGFRPVTRAARSHPGTEHDGALGT